MAYVIAEPCIGTKDTACVDACPVDCIHPKENTTYDDGRSTFDKVPQLYIDPVECIDCGACVPVCPVSAIFAPEDLPEKWKQYTELNESYVKAGKFTSEKFAKHQVNPAPGTPLSWQSHCSLSRHDERASESHGKMLTKLEENRKTPPPDDPGRSL